MNDEYFKKLKDKWTHSNRVANNWEIKLGLLFSPLWRLRWHIADNKQDFPSMPDAANVFAK